MCVNSHKILSKPLLGLKTSCQPDGQYEDDNYDDYAADADTDTDYGVEKNAMCVNSHKIMCVNSHKIICVNSHEIICFDSGQNPDEVQPEPDPSIGVCTTTILSSSHYESWGPNQLLLSIS